jgi:NADH-quinone oxidoreductase subunit C
MIRYHKENLTRVAARTGDFLGEKLLGKEEKSGYFQFSVRAPDYKPLIRFLKEDADLGFTYFLDLCGADYLKYPQSMPERFGVLATLLSPGLGVKAQVRAFVPGSSPRLASVADLFPGADWTEREVWDLYGIEFTGHPDLQRILLPDDYEGHPLRTDYPLRGRGERASFPVYHAVPAEKAPKE